MSETGPVSRGERKERTRRRLLDAALLLSEDSGFAALSLRQVAKEVGVVPTAFYRHFSSLDDLGLELVEESFVSLRSMLREVRQGSQDIGGIIERSVDVLVDHAHRHRGHFRFIARERSAGTPPVRQAVRHELDLVVRELATDVGRFAGIENWSHEDLRILCELIVDAMVATTERLLLAPESHSDQIAAVARRQLQMLVVGAVHWGTTPT